MHVTVCGHRLVRKNVPSLKDIPGQEYKCQGPRTGYVDTQGYKRTYGRLIQK